MVWFRWCLFQPGVTGWMTMRRVVWRLRWSMVWRTRTPSYTRTIWSSLAQWTDRQKYGWSQKENAFTWVFIGRHEKKLFSLDLSSYWLFRHWKATHQQWQHWLRIQRGELYSPPEQMLVSDKTLIERLKITVSHLFMFSQKVSPPPFFSFFFIRLTFFNLANSDS